MSDPCVTCAARRHKATCRPICRLFKRAVERDQHCWEIEERIRIADRCLKKIHSRRRRRR